MTVRETENLVRRILEPKPVATEKPRDPDVISLEQRLSERFAAPVQISYNNKGKGKLEISYSSLAELDGIIGKLNLADS